MCVSNVIEPSNLHLWIWTNVFAEDVWMCVLLKGCIAKCKGVLGSAKLWAIMQRCDRLMCEGSRDIKQRIIGLKVQRTIGHKGTKAQWHKGTKEQRDIWANDVCVQS